MALSISYLYEIIDKYTAPLKKIRRETDRFIASITHASNANKKLAVSLRRLKESTKSLKFDTAAAKTVVFESSIRELKVQLGRAATKIRSLEGALSKLKPKFGSNSKAAKGFSRSMRSFGSGMESTGRELTTRITLATAAVGAFSLKAFAAAEKSEIGFGVMLRSMSKGKKLFKDLTDFAARTPFRLPEVLKGARVLLAFGVQNDKLLPQLKRLGDVAAGVNAPLAEVAQIFGKTNLKGKALMEEMNQMSERGIPILMMLAKIIKKKFNVSMEQATARVFKMAEQSQITNRVVARMYKQMTEEGGIFYEMTEKQSKTLGGRFSTFLDIIFLVSIKVGEALEKAFNIKKMLIKGIAAGEKFRLWITEVMEQRPGLVQFTFAFVALVATLGPALIVLGAMIKVLGLLGITFKAVTWPMTKLTLKFALIAFAVKFVIMMFKHWVKTNHPVVASFRRLGEALIPVQEVGKTLAPFFERLSEAFGGNISLGGILAGVFDVIGISVMVVVDSLTILARLLTGDFKTAGDVFDNMLKKLDVFAERSGFISEIYKGMVRHMGILIRKISTPFMAPDLYARSLGRAMSTPAVPEPPVTPVSTTTVQHQMASGVLTQGTFMGLIRVVAEAGTRVIDSDIRINQGNNLATIVP